MQESTTNGVAWITGGGSGIGRAAALALGAAMEVGFHDLVAHAASTRELCAGTIIGSGTVSNPDFAEVGSSCIAEARGAEIVAHGAPRTAFMTFGDRVRMEAVGLDGSPLFGVIDQRVVSSAG